MSSSSNIKVAVRVRPLLESEKARQVLSSKLRVDANLRQIQVQVDENNAKKYQFDFLSSEETSQKDFYESINMRQLIVKVIEGFHSTVFAYGQTGSGKTFTMEGNDDSQPETTTQKHHRCKQLLDFKSDNQGLIPRSIADLFSQVESASKQTTRKFKVYVSYFQIYNEKIYDLLNTTSSSSPVQPLRLRWSHKDQFQVENLFVSECSTPAAAMSLLATGITNKAMASHRLNAQSSRSHCVFTLKVESTGSEQLHDTVSARLHLVDLAGSERQSQTGTEGIHFKECVEINKSLFTLRQVISALSEKHKQVVSSTQINSQSRRSIQMPPYRNSKLTSILKQSIGGSSYCLMVACVSPCDTFTEENLSTLQYAVKAGSIVNDPTKNEDPQCKLIAELKTKIEELTTELIKTTQHISFLGSELHNYHQRTVGNHNIDSLHQSGQVDKSTVDSLGQSKCIEPSLAARITSQQMAIEATSSLTKRLEESSMMVRDLLSQNIGLRGVVERLTKSSEVYQLEQSELLQENNDLREKIEILWSIISSGKRESGKGGGVSFSSIQYDYKKILMCDEDEEEQDISLSGVVTELQQLRSNNQLQSSHLKQMEAENAKLHQMFVQSPLCREESSQKQSTTESIYKRIRNVKSHHLPSSIKTPIELDFSYSSTLKGGGLPGMQSSSRLQIKDCPKQKSHNQQQPQQQKQALKETLISQIDTTFSSMKPLATQPGSIRLNSASGSGRFKDQQPQPPPPLHQQQPLLPQRSANLTPYSRSNSRSHVFDFTLQKNQRLTSPYLNNKQQQQQHQPSLNTNSSQFQNYQPFEDQTSSSSVNCGLKIKTLVSSATASKDVPPNLLAADATRSIPPPFALSSKYTAATTLHRRNRSTTGM